MAVNGERAHATGLSRWLPLAVRTGICLWMTGGATRPLAVPMCDLDVAAHHNHTGHMPGNVLLRLGTYLLSWNYTTVVRLSWNLFLEPLFPGIRAGAPAPTWPHMP